MNKIPFNWFTKNNIILNYRRTEMIKQMWQVKILTIGRCGSKYMEFLCTILATFCKSEMI